MTSPSSIRLANLNVAALAATVHTPTTNPTSRMRRGVRNINSLRFWHSHLFRLPFLSQPLRLRKLFGRHFGSDASRAFTASLRDPSSEAVNMGCNIAAHVRQNV